MEEAYPIVRHPEPGMRSPVLVSVPHYGTQPLPHITRDDYGEPWFETFAYGFADTFASDLYGDLHEHGATVLATPLSRMFCDVNRRRDDFEHRDGEVRSRRGVVRTHTMRDVAIFTRPLGLDELEARLVRPLRSLLLHAAGIAGRPARRVRLRGAARRAHREPAAHEGPRDHHRHPPRETCAPALAAAVREVFTRHGFDGARQRQRLHRRQHRGHVRPSRTRRVHALQLEINASLLMTTSRDEFIAHITRGGIPEKAEENIAASATACRTSCPRWRPRSKPFT